MENFRSSQGILKEVKENTEDDFEVRQLLPLEHDFLTAMLKKVNSLGQEKNHIDSKELLYIYHSLIQKISVNELENKIDGNNKNDFESSENYAENLKEIKKFIIDNNEEISRMKTIFAMLGFVYNFSYDIKIHSKTNYPQFEIVAKVQNNNIIPKTTLICTYSYREKAVNVMLLCQNSEGARTQQISLPDGTEWLKRKDREADKIDFMLLVETLVQEEIEQVVAELEE